VGIIFKIWISGIGIIDQKVEIGGVKKNLSSTRTEKQREFKLLLAHFWR